MTMDVVKLPGKISAYRVLSRGAIGWVYQINDRIALKYAREPDSKEFAKENDMFDLFEKHPPCPHVVQSFLRLPDANFLAFMSGGSLDDRLKSHQVRDGPFGKVLRVDKAEPVELVERWLRELCGAVVWLESLGYVHGDLRPSNFLLDRGDHLKLGDFDCAEKVSEPSSGNGAPWARVLGDDEDEVGAQRGSFGINGPRTEQFAIGSNLYYMVYGFEPYEDRDDRGPVIVELLQDMKFPELRDGRLDSIIHRCWRGRYQQLKDLLEEVETVSGMTPSSEAVTISREYLDDYRDECQALVEDGLLGDTWTTGGYHSGLGKNAVARSAIQVMYGT
ncbi:kinase domain-containing protein [Biscogniauxia marginata]|nr:kinase domain-containing protein [Biscogniauxia marginata]